MGKLYKTAILLSIIFTLIGLILLTKKPALKINTIKGIIFFLLAFIIVIVPNFVPKKSKK